MSEPRAKNPTRDVETQLRFTHDGGHDILVSVWGCEYTFEFVLMPQGAEMLLHQLTELLRLTN